MVDMFKQYFKIIGNALVGIAFGFGFFYLLLNVNHYFEIRRTIPYTASTDSSMKNLDSTISKINQNISTFSLENYNGSLTYNEASSIQNKFKVCVEMFNNETIRDIKGKNKIDIRDVYNLRESYENSVASKCLVTQFVWITTVDDSYQDKRMVENKGIYSLIFNDLISDTDYIKKDLLNNSSYYFSTDISLLTGKNLTKDSFYEVLSSYNKAANFLLELSEWYKDAVTTEVQQ